MAGQTTNGWAVPSPAGVPTIAVGNQKGGTGKTTATINLSAALAQEGNSVLTIDMDPQGDLTNGLGFGESPEDEPENPKHDLPNITETDDANLLDLLADHRRAKDIPIEDLIIHQDDHDHLSYDLVPSHKDMSLARDWMAKSNSRDALKKELAAMTERGVEYDYIVIDCPPDLSVLTDAAFIAARNVLIAAQTHATSRNALDQLIEQIETVEELDDTEMAIVGLLANMHRQDGQSAKFLKKFEDEWEARVPFFKLNMAVAIQRAWDNGQDIYTWEDANDQSTERETFVEMADGVKEAFGQLQPKEA
jgi:chromosome partitioning protein